MGVRLCQKIVVLLCLLITANTNANQVAVPPALKDWVPWVMDKHPQQACPFMFNNANARSCAWPSHLHLTIDGQRLRFDMRWQVFDHSRVPLPGEKRFWPEKVLVDNLPVPVVAQQGRPVITLAPGDYRVQGQIQLRNQPDSLALPTETGLVSLTLNGSKQRHPAIDEQGRLWLKQQGEQAQRGAGDSLSIRVYRRLSDDVPMRLETRLQLEVAGKARETVVGPALLPGFAPLSLSSPLPARLEQDGALRLQVRPGRWDVLLQARALDQVHSFSVTPGAQWPQQEVWSLQAAPALRSWRVEGVNAIDPGQAGVPGDWTQLPAYPMSASGSLTLVEEARRRDSADSLTVQRELWRDFDGQGYTFRDRIQGTLSADGRLEGDGLEPGRVMVNGQPAMITHHQGRTGVELRRGTVNLDIIGRMPDNHTLPASGWGRDLDQLAITLHLPPGNLLWGASDVDRISNAWVSRWSLWDIFLLLVLVVGSFRLAGPVTAVVAALALLICHNVEGAPYYSWLNLLVVLALLKVLPSGKVRHSAQLWLGITVLSMALMLLPFAVQQFRQAVYPQLELGGHPLLTNHYNTYSDDVMELEERAAAAPEPAFSSDIASGLQAKAAPSPRKQKPLQQAADPDARIQTGPGVPAWHWREARLSWQGPVAAEQTFSLWQSGNGLFSAVSVLRVLLLVTWLALLLKPLLGSRGTPGFPWTPASATASSTTTAAALLLALTTLWPGQQAHADLPSPALLEELEQRLLQPPECLPTCADISDVRLQAGKERWQLRLRVQVAEDTVLPLPAGAASWQPQQILVNGAAATTLRQQGGQLHIALRQGVHDLLLQGPAPVADSIALRFQPAPQHIDATGKGWRVAGIIKGLLPSGTLEVVREQQANTPDNRLVNPVEPPFAKVTRTLYLGMDWRLHTQVQRLAPSRGPLSIAVTTLPGEQVLSEMPVRDGQVQVQLGADQQQQSWSSRIEPSEQLTLSADNDPRFTLEWRLQADTRWHVTHQGLAPLLASEQAGTHWLPWPGESVQLTIERPEPAAGETLTIETASLIWRPGQRESHGELHLDLLSSRGDNYRLQLPPGSRAEAISMDGVKQALTDDRDLVIAVSPGQHQAVISWRSEEGRGLRSATPELDLGRAASNIQITLEQPRDRWTLAVGGPGYGPAVLFWGVLLALLLVAAGLGRLPLSPLTSAQWMLLTLGISSSALGVSIPVVLWFFVMALRAQRAPESPGLFNVVQILLVIFTVIALLSLLAVIPLSLVLSTPDMQISGNGSSASQLSWYLDKTSGLLPSAVVTSLPLWAYRALMLAWSLWLALALMRWLPWAWRSFSHEGLWRNAAKAQEQIQESQPKDTGQ